MAGRTQVASRRTLGHPHVSPSKDPVGASVQNLCDVPPLKRFGLLRNCRSPRPCVTKASRFCHRGFAGVA